jgi:group I intron endonuclease
MDIQPSSGIYKITSPSKKIYIGLSTNVKRRYYCYKRLDCKRQPFIYNSLKKYGFDNHKFEVLEYCEENNLNEKEAYYIDLFQSFNNDNGLNLSHNRNHFIKLSEESRKKLSNSLKGKNKTKGRKHTEETKRKIGEANRRRVIKDSTRLKQSILKKNMSLETRQKISISAKKRPYNPLFTTKGIPNKNKGLKNVFSKETILKMSLAKKGKENNRFNKKVHIVNILNGDVLYFESIKKASVYLNVNNSCVSETLIGKQKTCKGHNIFYTL